MAVDILKRTSMQKVVEELKPNGAFIGSRYFPMQLEVTEETIWDVVKPGEGLASVRAVDAEAKIIQKKSFDTKLASVTDFAAKERFNQTELRSIREAGELPVDFSGGTLAQGMAVRARQKVTKSLARLRQMVDNRLEWARIQALTGTLTYQDTQRDIKIDLDYGIPSDQELVEPDVDWDETATSDPIADIQTWMDTVTNATGVVPGEIILSRKALGYIARSDSVRSFFQYTSPMLTVLDATRVLEEKLGVKVTVYEARYYNDSNVWTRFLDEKIAILLPDISSMDAVNPFGDTAYVPHALNNYKGSYYVWQDEKKDPYGLEVGAGLTALPRIYTPEVILTAHLWDN